jgi:hypothetical protein
MGQSGIVFGARENDPQGVAPCYFFACCGNYSELTKEGKAVCRACSPKVRGEEFPLPVRGSNIFGNKSPNFWFGWEK